MPAPPGDTDGRQRHAEVSSIVEIDGVSAETADRLTILLGGSATNGRRGDEPLRIETAYDRERARMKIIVLGGLGATARLLDYVEGVLSS